MTKRFFFSLVLAAAISCVNAAEASYDIVPAPLEVTLGEGSAFTLSSSTAIVCPGADDAMLRNAAFLSEYIDDMTDLTLDIVSTAPKHASTIVLVVSGRIDAAEGYRMTVDGARITIDGGSAAGVFYGIQTLRKALPALDTAEDVTFAPVVITDRPRFAYRGMMLDCCRHFFPAAFVKRYIDILALHNMNRLHWHLADDQGWRAEITSHPELTEIGSMRSGTIMGHNGDVDDGTPHGGYYTQDEMREIVQYATERYITVIPEIDLPGHTLAVLAAHPELGCTGGPYEVCHSWGVFADVLCIGNEDVYPLLEDVIDELVDIFPSEYIHIGGDECPTDRWRECEKCTALAEANGVEINHLQGVFTNRLETYVNSKGRRIIGWDEILEANINPSATIMSWRGVEPGGKAAALGHDVIMAPNTYAYLDYYQTDNRGTEPMCIGGYLPIDKVYSLDPAPDTLSDEAKSHILGAQANLWTEYITCPNMVEYMVMPRMAAMAEVQWTAPQRKDYDAFVARLTRLTTVYDKYGYYYGLHLWKEKYNEDRGRW